MENRKINRLFDLSDVQSNYYGPTATGMLGGSIYNYMIGGSKSYEEVAYPEYIRNQDFQTFISSIHRLLCQGPQGPL